MEHASDGHADACLWRELPRGRPRRASLVDDHDVEVLIVGAGIVGLTAALLAAERGMATTLLEAREVGAGTSGATTGKFSVINGMRYHRLRRRYGRAGASAYAMAARSGIERTVRLVEEHGIECGIEHVRSHLAVTTQDRAKELELEVAAAADAGLRPIRGWDGHDIGLPVRDVATFRHEVQLHPVAYLDGLAARYVGAGGALFERSAAVALHRDGGRWQVRTRGGTVRADHVIVATRLPVIGDHRLTFARATPVGACVVAGVVTREALPRSNALVLGDATWSVRASRWQDVDGHLVVVGPDVPEPGRERTTEAVEAWATTHWPDLRITHRWFAQDQQPVDERPLVGRIRDGSVWAATGFGKWGLALGTYAAERIVAGIAGEEHPAAGFFEPRRLHVRRALAPFVAANIEVARRWATGRLPTHQAPERLEPGDGRVRRVAGRTVAEARDQDGTLYRLDARCTHLGCPVSWNAASRSWDCRCHGARYAIDGRVLEAPAIEPLDPLDDERNNG